MSSKTKFRQPWFGFGILGIMGAFITLIIIVFTLFTFGPSSTTQETLLILEAELGDFFGLWNFPIYFFGGVAVGTWRRHWVWALAGGTIGLITTYLIYFMLLFLIT